MTTLNTQRLAGMLGDMRLLVMLFISFRVVMLLGYFPTLQEGAERGVGVYGDRAYHYALAQLTDDDLWPFRDWWSEFPPLWPLVTSSLYAALGASASYDNWSLVLGVVMIASETGILLCVRSLGGRLHSPNTGMALAWVYALLAAPMVYSFWNFDSLATLCLLLAIQATLHKRDGRAALFVALGALTKFVPLLLWGALVRFVGWQRSARHIALAAALIGVSYGALFALNSQTALVSLTAQFGKPSYQTVWALLDGNYTTGNFGSVASHLDVNRVNEGLGARNPALIPSWLRLGVAAALGLFVFWRTRRLDEVGLVAFVAITFVIFYVQSQGWSPQWLSQLIPLLLLVFPTRDGVYGAILLSLLAFVEWPFLFIRTETGIMADPWFTPWVLVVLARTGVLIGLGLALYRRLRQLPVQREEMAS